MKKYFLETSLDNQLSIDYFISMLDYMDSIAVVRDVVGSHAPRLRPFSNVSNLKYSIGNLKIGKDTMIINMGTAHACPSAKLGLCSMSHRKFGGDGKCYALKAEYLYPSAFTYRSIQKLQWDHWDADKIANEIFNVLLKKKKIKYIRFNEAGDFHSIEQVRKADRVARLIKEFCLLSGRPVVKFYTYTHRSDIFEGNSELINSLSDNFTINGSNFMVHNNFKVLDIKRSERDKRENGKKVYKFTCLDDCSKCSLCKIRGKGIDIIQAKH